MDLSEHRQNASGAIQKKLLLLVASGEKNWVAGGWESEGDIAPFFFF